MIDGQSYPYSPSPAGANNARSLLDDAMAAVAEATAPRAWKPGDLKAVTERAIANRGPKDGRLFEEEITKGRFRQGGHYGLIAPAYLDRYDSEGTASPSGDRTVSQEEKGLDKESAALECAPKMSAADRAAARAAKAERKAKGK